MMEDHNARSEPETDRGFRRTTRMYKDANSPQELDVVSSPLTLPTAKLAERSVPNLESRAIDSTKLPVENRKDRGSYSFPMNIISEMTTKDSTNPTAATSQRATGSYQRARKPHSIRGMSRTRESRDFLPLKEALAAMLVPLPFVVLPFLWNKSSILIRNFGTMVEVTEYERDDASACLDACPYLNLFSVSVLTSTTLLCIGALGELRGFTIAAEKQARTSSQRILSTSTLQRILGRILSIGLPFFAAGKIGGERVATIILSTVASNLMSTRPKSEELQRAGSIVQVVKPRKWTIAAIMLQLLLDLCSISQKIAQGQVVLGYVALATSVIMFPIPYPTTRPEASVITSPISKHIQRAQPLNSPIHVPDYVTGTQVLDAQSPLISTPWDTDLTLASGVLTGFLGVVHLLISPTESRSMDQSTLICGIICIACSVFSLLTVTPRFLRSSTQIGTLLGLSFVTITSKVFFGRSNLEFTLQCTLSFISWVSVVSDFSDSSPHLGTNLSQNAVAHTHEHYARITDLLLNVTTHWPLLHSILVEKDSRRILYFMSLNFAFMLIQTFYGYVSKSLGLLSDSVHMFFDCVALLVGLAAAIMSKWPPDTRFPYGYGMIDTLAGFANGVFLMLISLEIIYEAIERLVEGSKMHRITELLIVSALGLAVNCVGMLAFGHAHHGHGHSHDHAGHGHSHKIHHGHDNQNQQHDFMHGHEAYQKHQPLPGKTHYEHNHKSSHDHPSIDGHLQHRSGEETHKHSHHSHSNENMAGIWLHVLADTLGSAAVVVSTILVQLTGWAGFDPLASCLIAVLIFASAVPLVLSTAKKLLLTVPEAAEFDIWETIAEVRNLRGVSGVTISKIWINGGEASYIQGIMHVLASHGGNIDDVRVRVLEYIDHKNMEIIVQVERESDNKAGMVQFRGVR